MKTYPYRLNRKGGALNLSLIALIYALMVMGVILAESFHLWKIRVLALFPLALLFDYLLILQHEGSHFLLVPNRRWNDLFTNFFCSFPLLSSVGQYRYFHADHHRYLGEPLRDPEIGFYQEQGHYFKPQTKIQFFRLLLKDASGFHYFGYFFSYYRYVLQEASAGRIPRMASQTKMALFVFGLSLLFLANKFGAIYFYYWLAPQATVFFLLTKLAGYAEHTGKPGPIFESTYAHRFHFWSRLLVYPLNSDLHLEHHLAPQLPWFSLRRVSLDIPEAAPQINQWFYGPRSFFRKMIR